MKLIIESLRNLLMTSQRSLETSAIFRFAPKLYFCHETLEMEESFIMMEENMMEEEEYFLLRRRGINSVNLMLTSWLAR